MYDRVLHNRWSKLATAVAGAVLMAVAINLFIVPQGLYTGGLLGLCQVIRTLLVTKLGPDLSCEQRAAAASGV